MENTTNVIEEITTAIDAKTIEIPVRVKMTSVYDAPFEFTSSIDEAGQIVLTPTSKDVEFVDANTDANIDYEIPVVEQETIITTEGNVTIKELSIVITATLLQESNTDHVSATVDEIGQCIIYPMSKDNSFITASINDSLNLVTEDLDIVNYFGYVLRNTGDGWDVIYNDEVIEEGLATMNAAKVFVCTTELEKLQESMSDSSAESTEQANISPEVEATVIEEAVLSINDSNEYDVDTILSVLTNVTNNFTEEDGAVRCDTLTEKSECIKILQTHYSTVGSENMDGYFVVTYQGVI